MDVLVFGGLAACFLLGAILGVLGWRGRRLDDHPVCRRCRFDLFGQADSRSGACPECGAALDRPRAVRRGNRQYRPLILALGMVMLLLAGVTFGSLAAGWLTGTSLNPYKPLWLLRWEARQTAIVQPAGSALDEIRLRLQAGQLSAADLEKLLGDALTVQADQARPWHAGWGDLVLDLHAANVGSPQAYERYAQGLFVVTPRIRAQVRQGEAIPVYLELQAGRGFGSGGMSTAFHYIAHDLELVIGERRMTLSGSMSGGLATGSRLAFGRKIPTDRAPFDELPLGEHPVRAAYELQIRLGGGGGPLLLKMPLAFDVSFELVSPDTPLIERVARPDLVPTLAGHFRVQDLRTGRQQVGQGTPQVIVQRLDEPMAYEIWAVAGERSWKLGQFAVDAAKPTSPTHLFFDSFMLEPLPPEADVDRVDLHFRVSPEVARQTADLTRILDHDFWLRDVPVQRAPPAPVSP